MHIESITLTNFRCFGPAPTLILLDPGLTAMVGVNGSGKTAALEGIMRLFGVTQDQRRVRVQDFHASPDGSDDGEARSLSIDVILAFPEFAEDDQNTDAIPEFFVHMAAAEDGTLKCRIRLDASWTKDGSVDGTIVESRRVVHTLATEFADDDCSALSPLDRSRIQMIYVPAVRDGARHLTEFLRSRLWAAAKWSEDFRAHVEQAAEDLNSKFKTEAVVSVVQGALAQRWTELHTGGTNAHPTFRPVDPQSAGLIKGAELLFQPTETGHDRRADELSDGQRSLLHIALTSATLDIEAAIAAGINDAEFDHDKLVLPTLTILAVEEPENSLAPFFLSRIIRQMNRVAGSNRAQAVISSHSASVLARVEPANVRHFRTDLSTGTSTVRSIVLPADGDDAAKYVREAVRKYPELYFAEFVVLGEGSSEQVAIPLLAAAAGVELDQSFVAVVPLGGRHVNHLWRLLDDLAIPHATLLDLDRGRHGGGVGRVKVVHGELANLGITPHAVGEPVGDWNIDDLTETNLDAWLSVLRRYSVYYCDPLDLDWTLMRSFWTEYTTLDEGMEGPDASDAAKAVLGEKGQHELYSELGVELRWYRYLFLGRAKPSSHLRVLSRIPADRLKAATPEVLKVLLDQVKGRVA